MNLLLNKSQENLDTYGICILVNYNNSLINELKKDLIHLYFLKNYDNYRQIIETDNMETLCKIFEKFEDKEFLLIITNNEEFIKKYNLQSQTILVLDNVFSSNLNLDFKFELNRNILLDTNSLTKDKVKDITYSLLESINKLNFRKHIPLQPKQYKIIYYLLDNITNIIDFKKMSYILNIDEEYIIKTLEHLQDNRKIILLNISFNKLATFNNYYRLYIVDMRFLLGFLKIYTLDDFKTNKYRYEIIKNVLVLNYLYNKFNNFYRLMYVF